MEASRRPLRSSSQEDMDMPMNEVILSRRRALGMTQEQLAERLGVTAPAVNKWEKGATCPDLMLLSPLARLLGVEIRE